MKAATYKRDPLLEEILGLPSGEQIRLCIQCGTCAGSCPNANKMEFTPRQVVSLVRAGRTREVLQRRIGTKVKTLILGMGNPIVSDDGVAHKVAQRLREALQGHLDITVEDTSLSGLSLLELVAGYERAIIVDSIQTRGGRPGAVYRLAPDDFEVARHVSTVHDVGLLTALELGRRLNLDVPMEVLLFAVEVEDIETFSEECTPEVEKAIPRAVGMVLEELAATANSQGE